VSSSFEELSKGTWWAIDDNNVKLEWTSDSDSIEFEMSRWTGEREKRESPVRTNE
jgi:hypothetical protein